MENKNFTVGVFVALALLVFVTTAIWLTGRQGTEPMDRYSILFQKDVSGLMLGGPVFYRGVEVGEVRHMQIVTGNPVHIQVDIQVLRSTPIDSGTYASLALQGITGISIINLSSDPGEHPPLKPTEGFEYPLIEQRDSGFSALLDGAPDIISKLNSLLDRANALLNEETLASVQASLQNVEALTETLAGQRAAIESLPPALHAALNDARSLMADLHGVLEEAGPSLGSTLENLERATDDLADMADTLDSWVAGNDQEMQAFLGDGLGQVPELVADARQALRELEKLLHEIRQDPSGFIYKPEQDAVTVER